MRIENGLPRIPPPQAAVSGIKGDVLNCCGKMPSLRRAGLPGSFNLPKQSQMTPFAYIVPFAYLHSDQAEVELGSVWQ